MEFDNLALYQLTKLSHEKMRELRAEGKHLSLEYLHWNAIYTKSYILQVNRAIAQMNGRLGESGPAYVEGWKEEILEHAEAIGLDIENHPDLLAPPGNVFSSFASFSAVSNVTISSIDV